MCWYMSLNEVQPAHAVGFIRLQCEGDLQQALDNKYMVQQWLIMTQEQAFDVIKHMSVQPANEAAEKEEFYNIRQGQYESVSAYFARVTKVAANCAFQCPSCRQGLEEYLLLSKLVAGLIDPVLKREAFRTYGTFKSVNDLKTFCAAYESSMPKVGLTSYAGSGAEAAAAVKELPMPTEPPIEGRRMSGKVCCALCSVQYTSTECSVEF